MDLKTVNTFAHKILQSINQYACGFIQDEK